MEIATGYACPTCDAMHVVAMLFNEQFAASKGYYCRNGHQFDDLGDLKAMNPKRLPVPQRTTIQQGHEKVEMTIPSDMKADLIHKFGNPEQLSATLSGVLRALASPKCFIVSEEDIEGIEKIVGQNIRSARELVGLFWGQKEELNTARQKAAAAAQADGNGNGNGHALPAGTIAVNLSSHLPKINALATFRKETVEHVAESTLKMALDNGWA